VGRTCSTHEGGEKCFEGFGREARKDSIKMGLREIGIDGANWIRLAQDSVQWRVLVNAVMNVWVPLRKQAVI